MNEVHMTLVNTGFASEAGSLTSALEPFLHMNFKHYNKVIKKEGRRCCYMN
jgi:hypothetical protein